MTTRSMSTTAPSTATSSACARSSSRSTTISTPSRPCTASATATARAKLAVPDHPRRHARYSALTRRIVLVNGLVLLFLIGGVILVQSSRVGLVDERLSGIETQSQIVASTLAEYAT